MNLYVDLYQKFFLEEKNPQPVYLYRMMHVFMPSNLFHFSMFVPICIYICMPLMVVCLLLTIQKVLL